MIRPILLTTAALTSLVAPAVAETKTYDFDGFNAVDASRIVDVVYTKGETFRVIADIEDGDFDAVDLNVKNNVLYVSRPKEGLFGNSVNIQTNGKGEGRTIRLNGRRVPVITVYVTAPEIVGLSASSSSTIAASDLDHSALNLSASSSASIEARGISADQVKIAASSSGEIEAGGACTSLDISASSSADVKAYDLICTSADLSGSSSADIYASFDGGDVSAQASSSADITLKGTCNEFVARASSSGDVIAKALTCQDANARASSSGDISLAATGEVRARASSGGDIIVHGEPASLDKTESSGGDIIVKRS